MEKPAPLEFFVEDEVYTDLAMAVYKAKTASQGGRRSAILISIKKGIYGYAGYMAALAQFFDGQDVRALATDEDGVPDFELRSTAY